MAAIGQVDPVRAAAEAKVKEAEAVVKEAEAKKSTENRVLPSAESIKSIGGLVAVVIGVVAVTVLAIVTMIFIDSGRDATTIVPLSTAAFGVISAVVGAYLGIKIGTDQSKGLVDQSKGLVEDASNAHAKLAAIQQFVPAEKLGEAQKAAEKAVGGK
jgi:hypothetical protein